MAADLIDVRQCRVSLASFAPGQRTVSNATIVAGSPLRIQDLNP